MPKIRVSCGVLQNDPIGRHNLALTSSPLGVDTAPGSGFLSVLSTPMDNCRPLRALKSNYHFWGRGCSVHQTSSRYWCGHCCE
ncbi:Uncharacterised protein [Vibrio cholerae]|nr:Uncharacterised protein [Vibrio cholerae]